MAKKGRRKGRKPIAKKRPDKDVSKSQKAEGTDMPPPTRPLVLDPSTWQPQDNNGGRIAREHAAQRRRFVAATQSGAIEPLLPLRAAPGPTIDKPDLSPEPVAQLSGAGGLIADTVQTSPVKSRRAVGRSVRTNRIAIVLSVASLMVLIDDKLATLRDERPNARDAQAV